MVKENIIMFHSFILLLSPFLYGKDILFIYLRSGQNDTSDQSAIFAQVLKVKFGMNSTYSVYFRRNDCVGELCM